MYEHQNYENTWKLIVMANQERLEEANRIHLARLAQQSQPRQPSALAIVLAPFGRSFLRAATAVLASIWS